jgi:diguanylate cyclase (GGDEF)-like protein
MIHASRIRADPERRAWLAVLLAVIASTAVYAAPVGDDVTHRALAIEATLYGYPQRALLDLKALMPRAQAASPESRRLVYGLYGQAMVLAGETSRAADLANEVEAEATKANDASALAVSRLVRAAIESSIGDEGKSIALAREARELTEGSPDDEFVRYWAALAFGTSARTRGQSEQALAALHDAFLFANRAGNEYRRSSALYQISVLQVELKQTREALASSRSAFEDAKAANSVYAMVNAKMAESAVMEALDQPSRERALMEEALAIARKGHSQVAEGRALVNLADTELRARQFGAALDAARKALALAQVIGDKRLAAACKANMGFALLGLGRIAEGKRLTDEALADYERSRATAEIAALVDEYGENLERLGDYQGALKLYHREQALKIEIAQETQLRALLEVQEKYEAERRNREIDLLNRDNRLKTAELANRELQQHVWWLLAALFALSFVVVAVLYRKLRTSSNLLAQKNAELAEQSTRDPLTGLYNRRYFQDFISADAGIPERRRREDDHTVRALLLIDIDHFKETNDRFGHTLGDAVLVAVAARLRDSLRDSDMIVRWGGEEFLVLAPTNADRLDELATRILDAICREPIALDGKIIRTTASIGYLPVPLQPGDVALPWEKAISLVDMALYMAKVNGRNRAYGIRRVIRSDTDGLAAVQRDLEHAARSGYVEMAVVYGPYGAGGAQVDSQAVSHAALHESPDVAVNAR